MQNKFKLAMIVFYFLVQTGCSNDDQPRQLTPKERAKFEETKKLYEAEEQLKKEEAAAVKTALLNSSDKTLKEILANCRFAIEKYADSQNKGPFSNYMIDQYAADSYQYLASEFALMSDDQRIERLKKNKTDSDFNTKYAILRTDDSFNGPVKSVDKYECKITKDFAVQAVIDY